MKKKRMGLSCISDTDCAGSISLYGMTRSTTHKPKEHWLKRLWHRLKRFTQKR